MPAVKEDWRAHALRELERGGHRSGGARAAVIGFLADQDCCLTAREIDERLRRSGHDVGMASIYRALELLTELGLLHRFEMGEGSARYEPALPSGSHHHHLVCDSCGHVFAFEDPELERAIERAAARVTFAVGDHDITLRGRCATCDSARS